MAAFSNMAAYRLVKLNFCHGGFDVTSRDLDNAEANRAEISAENSKMATIWLKQIERLMELSD